MINFSSEFDAAKGIAFARFTQQVSPTFGALNQQIDRLKKARGEERRKAAAAIKELFARLRLERKWDERMFRLSIKFIARVNALNARACPGLGKLNR
jgi:hypothetical protein